MADEYATVFDLVLRSIAESLLQGIKVLEDCFISVHLNEQNICRHVTSLHVQERQHKNRTDNHEPDQQVSACQALRS